MPSVDRFVTDLEMVSILLLHFGAYYRHYPDQEDYDPALWCAMIAAGKCNDSSLAKAIDIEPAMP